MNDHMMEEDDVPTLSAEELASLIEDGLQELATGKSKPMSEFIAELRADFLAAYPDMADRINELCDKKSSPV